MSNPEEIIKKVYLSESVLQESTLDPIDLIETDDLTRRLFILITYVFTRALKGRKNMFERSDLPYPYTKLAEFIKKHVKTPPVSAFITSHSGLYNARLSPAQIEQQAHLLVEVASLPRDIQHELYDYLSAKLKFNFEYIYPKNTPNPIQSGFFYKDWGLDYDKISDKAIVVATYKKSEGETGINFNF